MQCCGSLSAPCRYRHPGSSPHSTITTVDRQHATMPASHVVWWWRVAVSFPYCNFFLLFFSCATSWPFSPFVRPGCEHAVSSRTARPPRSVLVAATDSVAQPRSESSLPPTLPPTSVFSSGSTPERGGRGQKCTRGSQTALGLADVHRRRRRMPRMWNSMTSRTASFLFVFLRSHIGVGSYANACTVHPYIVHTYMMQDRASSSRTTWPITRDERGRFTEPALGLSE